MEYSEEMVKVFTSIAKSGMSYVAHFKGSRCRYVVALTNNGTDRSYKGLVEQIKQSDSYSSLALEIDHTEDGLQVEVAARFDDTKEALDCAQKHGKAILYDSFRQKNIVLIDLKDD